MTFCAGLRVRNGIIGIADTRVTTSTEHIVARKLVTFEHYGYPMFIMTSGLRSIRDKALTYFDEFLQEEKPEFDKLYKAVNSFADQLRRVSKEDKKALTASGLSFNLNSIIGGQFEKDTDPKLYLLYPQANWVEVGTGTPYFLIGEQSFGKPILDRVLRYESSISTALKVGFLAFDATRASAVDVDFPIDVIIQYGNSGNTEIHRFERNELIEISVWWQEILSEAVENLPAEPLDRILSKLPEKFSDAV